MATFLEKVGEIRSRRTGEVYPASALEDKIASAYLNEHARLAERERAAAERPAATQLEAIAPELSHLDDHDDHEEAS